MSMDAVIGLDAIDAGPERLHLKTAGGAVRTIPWTAIKTAGTASKFEVQTTIQGVAEKTAPLIATHDSLWIVYEDGDFAQAMIEKSSPKRDKLLALFAQQLGARWRGDRLTPNDLKDAIFQMPIPPGAGSRRLMLMMVIAIAVMILGTIAIGYILARR